MVKSFEFEFDEEAIENLKRACKSLEKACKNITLPKNFTLEKLNIKSSNSDHIDYFDFEPLTEEEREDRVKEYENKIIKEIEQSVTFQKKGRVENE